MGEAQIIINLTLNKSDTITAGAFKAHA